jgi:alkaline phosphatase D
MSITGNWEGRRVGRRAFLGWAGAGAGSLALHASGVSSARAWAAPAFARAPFSLGVASGEPLPDGVVLWTRLAPDALQPDGGMPARKVRVRWEVAADERFRRVVRRGRTFATPELAHSVHVEVDGLRADREYFYRFSVGLEESPVGRTRTAPAPGACRDRLRFAFASCQDYQSGYYPAYGAMAQEDLDLVVHLGDYIYEGGVDPRAVRQHDGPEPVTLDQYRARYALYKSDPDLQAAHAAFPWALTLDDHEVDNDWAGEEPQDPQLQPRDAFLARRAAAFRAYYEHQPLRRLSIPSGPDMRLYRSLTFGDLAQFRVLDTRQYRDDHACDENGRFGGQQIEDCAERLDPARTMLGFEQERWLYDGLATSRARWNVLAQQVIMFKLDEKVGPGESYFSDNWNGYAPARDRLLGALAERRVANPVVITGDVHSFWVSDLKADFADPGSATVATEFVGTSISTPGTPPSLVTRLPENPHVKYYESRLRGYVRCDLDRERWRTDFRVVDAVTDPDAPVRTLSSWVVEEGRPGAQEA